MVKIDIISGFLGAGKTTAIKKLFESSFNKEKVVLIENEFGEIGIDGAFLKESGVEIKEINSGCICCSLVGDFSKSMKEVIDKFNPERIIIEPSGVGKLSDIIKAVKKVEEDIKLNIVATVVDGGKCNMYLKNFGEFYVDQVSNANTIIMSKTEKLSKEKLDNTVKLLKMLNDKAKIVTTPVIELDGNKLLEVLEDAVNLQKELLKEVVENLHHDHDECDCHEHEHHHHDHDECDCHEHEHHHHDHDEDECGCGCGSHEHHHHHHADEVFTSWGNETTNSYSRQDLENILKVLCDEDSGLGIVLRSKGIVKASDNDSWYYFDLVAGDYEIRLGEPDYTGRLVVIGSKIDTAKLEKLFNL